MSFSNLVALAAIVAVAAACQQNTVRPSDVASFTSSSQYSNGQHNGNTYAEKSYALDGNFNTYFHSQLEANPWVMVTLNNEVSAADMTVTVHSTRNIPTVTRFQNVVIELLDAFGVVLYTSAQLNAATTDPVLGRSVAQHIQKPTAFVKSVRVSFRVTTYMEVGEIEIAYTSNHRKVQPSDVASVAVTSQYGNGIQDGHRYANKEYVMDGDFTTYFHSQLQFSPRVTVTLKSPVTSIYTAINVHSTRSPGTVTCCMGRFANVLIELLDETGDAVYTSSPLNTATQWFGRSVSHDTAQPVTFKSVRVTFQVNTYMEISEIEVIHKGEELGGKILPSDVASITSSSQYSNGVQDGNRYAEKAYVLDGDFKSYFHSQSEGNPWVMVTLNNEVSAADMTVTVHSTRNTLTIASHINRFRNVVIELLDAFGAVLYSSGQLNDPTTDPVLGRSVAQHIQQPTAFVKSVRVTFQATTFMEISEIEIAYSNTHRKLHPSDVSSIAVTSQYGNGIQDGHRYANKEYVMDGDFTTYFHSQQQLNPSVTLTLNSAVTSLYTAINVHSTRSPGTVTCCMGRFANVLIELLDETGDAVYTSNSLSASSQWFGRSIAHGIPQQKTFKGVRVTFQFNTYMEISEIEVITSDCAAETPVPPTPAPPTPPPASCVGACLANTCTEGSTITLTAEGLGTSNALFGDGHYTEDSEVGAAAVHAGLLTVGEVKELSVICSGTVSSFTGSQKNGITSESYNTPYASFYFVGDTSLTETPPTPPPAPEVCYQAQCLLNKCQVTGQSKELIVTGSTSGAVYGTTVFTDDSPVAAAAVHAGALQAGQTGAVKVTCMGPQDTFTGSASNGVASLSYGYWQFSFKFDTENTPPPLPTSAPDTCADCLNGRCNVAGVTHTVTVTGSIAHKVWGTDLYTDDSHVGVAAVHAGVVAVGETKTITATCEGAQAAYTGSTRNAITTTSYGAWAGSFSLVTAPDATAPPPTPCQGSCMHNECAIPGATKSIVVVGATTGDVWGTDKYTDDSNVQVAAVHMGLVAVGDTATIKVRCGGPQDSWTGTTRNGATTLSYGAFWGYSFTLSA